MKIRACKPEYLERAKALDHATAEALLSRMRAKLFNRLEQEDISREEILGIQLEIEEDQLREWRARMALIRAEMTDEEKRPQKKTVAKKPSAARQQSKKTGAKEASKKSLPEKATTEKRLSKTSKKPAMQVAKQ